MINDKLFKCIVDFFKINNEDTQYIHSDNCTDDEQQLILIINEINKKYNCFTYDKVPYNYFLQDYDIGKFIDSLKQIAKSDINDLLKLKIYDFLWIKAKDYTSAKVAFNGFIDIISTSDEYEKNYYLFNRCTNIYLKLNDSSLEFAYQKTLYRMIDAGKNEKTAKPIRILELAFEKEFIKTSHLLSPMKDKFDQVQDEYNFYLFLGVADLYENILHKANDIKFTNRPCNIETVNYVRRKKVDWFLKQFNDYTRSPLERVDWAKKAITQLKSLRDSEDERRELQQKLYKAQQEIHEQMHMFSDKFDISDTLKYYDTVCEQLNIAELFYFFILGIEISSYHDARAQMMKIEGDMLRKHISSEQIINNDGKLLSIMPNWTDALINNDDKLLLPHVVKSCANIYNVKVNIGMYYLLNKVKLSGFDIDAETKRIVENSLFVPQNRRQSFETGLISGFKSDLISAMNILSPQVENSIRQLALICGDSISKINSDYTEEYLSLDGLLNSPKLNECVDDKLLFNILTVFNSKYGMNIRNLVAHGLFDDDEYNNTYAFFAWWMSLRLCVEFCPFKSDIINNINIKLKDIHIN